MAKKNDPSITISYIGPIEGAENTKKVEINWTVSYGDYSASDMRGIYLIIEYYNSDTNKVVRAVNTDLTIDKTSYIYTAPDKASTVYATVKIRYKYTSTVQYGKLVDVINSISSGQQQYTFVTGIDFPTSLSAPTVSIKGTNLTASIDGLSLFENNPVEFKVYIVGNGSPVHTASATIKTGYASITYPKVTTGYEYRVRYRIKFQGLFSMYSQFSPTISTAPKMPDKITSLKALSSTSVKIEWTAVTKAETYNVEYTTNVDYFDSSEEVQSITVSTNHAEITGLEAGHTYVFRVKAINEHGESGWRGNPTIKLGEIPTPPTTWSSTTTAVVGEPLILYWMHNSEDASDQIAANIELIIDGRKSFIQTYNGTCSTPENVVTKSASVNDGKSFTLAVGTAVTIEMSYGNTAAKPSLVVNGSASKPITTNGTTSLVWTQGAIITFKYDGANWVIVDNNAKKNTTSYAVDTSKYAEGAKIQWRVCTRGIIDAYSQWSVQRTVNVYAQPFLTLGVVDSNGNEIDEVKSYPICISATPGPVSQTPISYSLYITALNSYETYDQFGNSKWINSGDKVYTGYFNSSDNLIVNIKPSDAVLEINNSYKITCSVSMNSGLVAENSCEITVKWSKQEFNPQLEIIIDPDSLSANLRPYCETDSGVLIKNVTLSVYRREYDGRFTEIATNLNNTDNTYVVDPHPSLDYARYRVVAMSNTTGSISYRDIYGVLVDEKSIVIQWDEAWTNFETDWRESYPVEPAWSGSMLKLPYNIDISDSNTKDVSHVEYIGRSHPVSYYGTQLGVTSKWSVDIPKDDKATLYALRRLMIWMGDVYVREPSGSGYWASISVSFSQTHCETTIPVTLDITRVEGGV